VPDEPDVLDEPDVPDEPNEPDERGLVWPEDASGHRPPVYFPYRYRLNCWSIRVSCPVVNSNMQGSSL
jgi:hypothetical protein